MKRLAKSFELSSWAASLVGPKIAARRRGSVDDAGGERRLRADDGEVDFFAVRRRRPASGSVMATFSSSMGSCAVPALPGAT
jgi:hypothetical protein